MPEAPPVPAARYQPALHWYSHLWRLLLCAGISAVSWTEVVQHQWTDHRAWFWLAIGLGAVSYPLVLLRRRHPLPVTLVLLVASAFSSIAAGPAVLATVSLATRRRPLEIALVGAVSLVTGTAYTALPSGESHEPLWLDVTFNLAATAALLGWGMYLGSRRELLWRLREQVREAEEREELRAAQARTSERSRIAREMHDVLAHRISQISMHANAVMFRADLTPDQVRESVGVIQEKAHQALTDLRSVLGVLRDEVTGEVLDRPQPTLADLPALVEECRGLGMHVEYDDGSGLERLPEVTGRTVYRIVQEGLTNARKHAAGAKVTVSVSGDPDRGVTVDVRNPLGFHTDGAPESGLGLVGLRERTELRGGRLSASRVGATWVLRAWIPWAA